MWSIGLGSWARRWVPMLYDVVHLNEFLDRQEWQFPSRSCRCLCGRYNLLLDPRRENSFKKNSTTPNERLTLACSIAACAAFSASLCRRSFSLSENMATERALFTRLCLIRVFLAANSAAFASSSVVGVVLASAVVLSGIAFTLWLVLLVLLLVPGVTGAFRTGSAAFAGSGWCTATETQDGAFFSGSTVATPWLDSSLAMQSMLRWIGAGSIDCNLFTHSGAPTEPMDRWCSICNYYVDFSNTEIFTQLSGSYLERCMRPFCGFARSKWRNLLDSRRWHRWGYNRRRRRLKRCTCRFGLAIISLPKRGNLWDVYLFGDSPCRHIAEDKSHIPEELKLI